MPFFLGHMYFSVGANVNIFVGVRLLRVINTPRMVKSKGEISANSPLDIRRNAVTLKVGWFILGIGSIRLTSAAG